MAATLNLHKLFSGRGGFLDDLRVDPDEERQLRSAREEIRETLRGAFRNWEQHVRRVELFDGLVLKSDAEIRLPAPKFRIQGSFAYATVNDVQLTPPQQIDQDDGVFLPIGFLTSGGRTTPQIASRAYFDLVERALEPLCRSNGWRLNPGGPKDNCVRVEISDRLHIDLPLYAIRDEAFEELIETATVQRSVVMDALVELAEDVYRGLADTDIMVADRRKGWIESDPRKLEDWFNGAIKTYGAQVRRLSRAYKGQRDAMWERGGPSSIALMAGVVAAFERLGPLDDSRDDLALLQTAREMVEIFANPIENPVFPGEADKCLCVEEDLRSDMRDLLRDTAEELDAAIHRTLNRDVALGRVRNAFGPRVPNDTDLISIVGAVEVIRQTQPVQQAKPMPVRTKSG